MCSEMNFLVENGVNPSEIVCLVSRLGQPGQIGLKSVKNGGFATQITLTDTSGGALGTLEDLFRITLPQKKESELILKVPETIAVERMMNILRYMKGEDCLEMKEIIGANGVFVCIRGPKSFAEKVIRGKFEFAISEAMVSRLSKAIAVMQPNGVSMTEKKEKSENRMCVEGIRFDVTCGIIV